VTVDSVLHIAVGVIRDAGGRILISERKADCAYAGQWEFPGGKCEQGEPVETALARELLEELGLQILSARPLIRLSHRYPDRYVLLDTWEVTAWQGRAEGREGQRIEWVTPAGLEQYPMLAANRPILRAAQLPPHYLITPEPSLDNLDGFITALAHSLKAGVRLVRLRAPALADAPYQSLVRACLPHCQQHAARLLLDRRPEWVESLGADGLHLSATAFAEFTRRPLARNYLLATSCHTTVELEKAVACDADFAVLGPVQATVSHPQAKPLGWIGFAQAVGDLSIPVYGIGGLGRADTVESWHYRAQGIAAIRGLWQSA
jgi:8-oxo-dGTP diphosphatase